MPEFYRESIVGTYADNFFCRLLFDYQNRTLRVVDFKNGKSAAKHDYLERLRVQEGIRKILTIVERSEVKTWQCIDYRLEGSIPSYFNRTDGYIMSRIYDNGGGNGETKELEIFKGKIDKKVGEMAKQEPERTTETAISEYEAIEAIEKEHERLNRNKKKLRKIEGPQLKSGPNGGKLPSSPILSVFPRFGYGVKYLHFMARNTQTGQVSIARVEYMKHFNNAKIDILPQPRKMAESKHAENCLCVSLEKLEDLGVGVVFSLAPTDSPLLNALYSSSGFENTGQLSRQLINDKCPIDLFLWTKKLGFVARNRGSRRGARVPVLPALLGDDR